MTLKDREIHFFFLSDDKNETLYVSQAKSALSRKGFGSVVGERDDLGEKMANLALLPN